VQNKEELRHFLKGTIGKIPACPERGEKNYFGKGGGGININFGT
jgi:hypothetical protein